jgi:hypothetical protein
VKLPFFDEKFPNILIFSQIFIIILHPVHFKFLKNFDFIKVTGPDVGQIFVRTRLLDQRDTIKHHSNNTSLRQTRTTFVFVVEIKFNPNQIKIILLEITEIYFGMKKYQKKNFFNWQMKFAKLLVINFVIEAAG